MDYKKAKEILLGLTRYGDELSENMLDGGYDYGLIAYARDSEAYLEGKFTADQLEAIALWKRNPKEVVNS